RAGLPRLGPLERRLVVALRRRERPGEALPRLGVVRSAARRLRPRVERFVGLRGPLERAAEVRPRLDEARVALEPAAVRRDRRRLAADPRGRRVLEVAVD